MQAVTLSAAPGPVSVWGTPGTDATDAPWPELGEVAWALSPMSTTEPLCQIGVEGRSLALPGPYCRSPASTGAATGDDPREQGGEVGALDGTGGGAVGQYTVGDLCEKGPNSPDRMPRRSAPPSARSVRSSRQMAVAEPFADAVVGALGGCQPWVRMSKQVWMAAVRSRRPRTRAGMSRT